MEPFYGYLIDLLDIFVWEERGMREKARSHVQRQKVKMEGQAE